MHYKIFCITDGDIPATNLKVTVFGCGKVKPNGNLLIDFLKYKLNNSLLENFIIKENSDIALEVEQSTKNYQIVNFNLDDFNLKRENINGKMRNNYYHKNTQI